MFKVCNGLTRSHKQPNKTTTEEGLYIERTGRTGRE
jgi:hypothetical protein